jgi:hypothetical protein
MRRKPDGAGQEGGGNGGFAGAGAGIRIVRVAAVAGVLALAGLLGWRLAHQDTKTARAVLHGKVVPAPPFRLQSAAERWAGRDVEVVGVDTVDNHGAARDFARKHGVTYPIGFDDVAEVANRYGVAYTPTTFFVDRRGRIVKRILGSVTAGQLDTQIKRALRT